MNIQHKDSDRRAKTVDEDSPSPLPSNCWNNFWLMGNYSTSLTRIEYSHKIVSELSIMYDEASQLEAKQGKAYTELGEKWCKRLKLFEESSENNMLMYQHNKENTIKFVEAFLQKGKSHIESWTQLQTYCIEPLNRYKNETLHKTFNGVRESKEIREDFKTTQEPYIEVHNAYKKALSNYMTYCLSIKPTFTLEAWDEFVEGLESKKKEKADRLRKRYIERLEQLKLLLPRYKEKMVEVYNKCDEIERAKLSSIKKAMEGFINVFKPENNKYYVEFISQLEKSVENFDIDKDLEWWSSTFGPQPDYDFFSIEEFMKKKPQRITLARSSTYTKENTEDENKEIL